MDNVEMLDVSCGIYDDVGHSRVYYLVRRRERIIRWSMHSRQEENRKNVAYALLLREITLPKAELNFLVKAYFRPRRLYLPENNFIAVW